MPCTDETWENKVRYCKFGEYWLVGDNETVNKANAVSQTTDVSGVLTIPRTVNGIPVKEIGQWAFYRCGLVTSIVIKARITTINYRGFSQMPSVGQILLPSTLEYILYAGIDLYNFNTASVTTAVTIISIERGSKLKYIAASGISY